MTKPILYGVCESAAVRAVLLTAEAIGLDLEFKVLNMKENEHKTEAFLKKNPQHTIPTLEDGGKCIWDSHAIITYLVGKYAKNDSLCPKDLYTRAVIDQRLHFESGVLVPRMYAFGEAQKSKDPEKIEKATTSLHEVYDFLEKFLDNNKYFVGNSMTVADFSILASFSTISSFSPADPQKFPKLNAWLNRMKELPYYEKANGDGVKKVVAYILQQAASN